MKAIMISIKPKWCAKIMNGDKTVEVRTSKALATAVQKLIDENGYADIYVYCTKDNSNLLHKNCADIYWVEDKYFRNKNKQLGLTTQPILNGKVLFKFRCYKVEELYIRWGWGWEIKSIDDIRVLESKTCLTRYDFAKYLKGKRGCAIHISDLEIFDRPREVSEFIHKVKVVDYYKPFDRWVSLTKAPQNMVYIESEE